MIQKVEDLKETFVGHVGPRSISVYVGEKTGKIHGFVIADLVSGIPLQTIMLNDIEQIKQAVARLT